MPAYGYVPDHCPLVFTIDETATGLTAGVWFSYVVFPR